MTVPSGTYQRFQQIGVREDLSDIIFSIDPVETPVVSAMTKVKATNTLHEWQTDVLDAAAANTKVEGDDATVNTATPTVRLQDYAQIMTKVVSISGTAQAVDTAGRDDEESYQLAKRGKELKRDLEFAIVRNQASSAGSASVPRTMAGMEGWLFTNRSSVGTGTSQTTPGYTSGNVASPTDSTVAGSVSETIFKALIQQAWSAGGNPRSIYVNGTGKQKLSAFTGIATQYRDNKGTGQATILGAADVYVSDFGVHNIIPCRQMRTSVILGLDMDYWKLATLRNMERTALAKTGDSDKTMLVWEGTLEACNERASFKISDINFAL